MHWLLVALIVCAEFLTMASCDRPKVLIKREHINDVIYSVAELDIEKQWSLRIIKVESSENDNRSNANSGINKIVLNFSKGFEFQFIEKVIEENERLVDQIFAKPWIHVTRTQPDTQSNYILNFYNKIQLKDKDGRTFFGVKLDTYAIMVVISSSYRGELEKLFKGDIWLRFELTNLDIPKIKSTIMVDVENCCVVKVSHRDYILSLTYWQIDVRTRKQTASVIFGENDRRTIVSSKCDLQFTMAQPYIGIGEIRYIEKETTMKLWIQKLWAWKADGELNNVDILRGVRSFSIAGRKGNSTGVKPTPSDKKQWVDIYDDIKVTKTDPLIGQFIVTLSFGVPGTLQYSTEVLKEVPAFFNPRNNRLTIFGTDLINFEVYRKAFFKNCARNPGGQEAVYKTKLPINFIESKADVNGDSGDSSSTAANNMFIQYIPNLKIESNDAFGFPIYQYECTM